jgi:hypothetical protein
LLGVIQHDMMMFDHGMPPEPKQSPGADINIEYQENSRMAAESAKLAAASVITPKPARHDHFKTGQPTGSGQLVCSAVWSSSASI